MPIPKYIYSIAMIVVIAIYCVPVYGTTINYTYDNLNRVTGVTYDGILKQYTYDAAGNRLSATDYDTLAPTGSLNINSNAIYTNAIAVTLNLSCTDGVGSGCSEMQFSNDNSTWSASETYAASKTWSLDAIDGTRNVYAKFKDVSGKWSSVYTSSIILDTTPPITTASPATGTYMSQISVVLAANEASTIYYTRDGSSPTTSSTVYSSPIAISTNTALKFFARDLAGNNEVVNNVAYYFPVRLTLNFAGSGSGTVASNPPAMGCGTTCSALFDQGTPVTLSATPSTYSLFGGWSGACSGLGDCSVSMSSDKTVTVTFNNVANPVCIDQIYYTSIVDAYLAAPAVATIKLWGTDFTVDLIFDRNKTVTLQGGYDESYSNNNGITTIHGLLSVSGGTVIIDNLTIQ